VNVGAFEFPCRAHPRQRQPAISSRQFQCLQAVQAKPFCPLPKRREQHALRSQDRGLVQALACERASVTSRPLSPSKAVMMIGPPSPHECNGEQAALASGGIHIPNVSWTAGKTTPRCRSQTQNGIRALQCGGNVRAGIAAFPAARANLARCPNADHERDLPPAGYYDITSQAEWAAPEYRASHARQASFMAPV
jgi:hypothetical protein